MEGRSDTSIDFVRALGGRHRATEEGKRLCLLPLGLTPANKPLEGLWRRILDTRDTSFFY